MFIGENSGQGNPNCRENMAGALAFSALQHHLTLISDLIQVDVVMGVHPSLPLGGIQVILGNYLLSDWVWSDVPTQRVKPSSQVVSSESLNATPTVLPTCAVTRAMSCVSSGSSLENSDKNREPVFPLPAYSMPVSCNELVQELVVNLSVLPGTPRWREQPVVIFAKMGFW